MGLAASQARYLALTARKSDLEFQSQQINTRRLQLAYKTAEIAKAYSEGMNDKCIAIGTYSTDKATGDTTKKWDVLNFENLEKGGFMIIGVGGTPLDPAPYVSDTKEYVKTTRSTVYKPTNGTLDKATIDGLSLTDAQKTTFIAGTSTTASGAQVYTLKDVTSLDSLPASVKQYYSSTPTTTTTYATLSDTQYSSYTGADKYQYITSFKKNSNYAASNGMDLQSLLVSGKAQIVSKSFYQYLQAKGYSYTSGISPEKYAEALEEWQNNENDINANEEPSVIDWRSDESSNFKQRYYTENDADVLAKYEADTAEVQAQDKLLETEEKNIETQHKAIETEMENVKKVIQKNIEETFKIFS